MEKRAAGTAFVIGAVVVALLSGCTGTTGHLAIVSTRAVGVGDLAPASLPARRVSGKSCIDVIGVYPLAFPNFGNAISDALQASGTQVLTDVRIGYTLFILPFIYAKACYVVEGDAR